MEKLIKYLDASILIVILISAVFIGLETDKALSAEYGSIFHLADEIIVFIFIVELFIKVLFVEKKWWQYFLSAWNVFDFIIILLCLAPIILHNITDIHAVVAFRLIRLFRAFRVLRAFRLVTRMKPLQILIEALIRSIPSMGYITVLLALIFYIYAVIGVSLFGDFAQIEFGSLSNALLTLFKCITGGVSWSEVMEKCSSHTNSIAYISEIFFVSFLIIGGMVMLNLFVGIIVAELGKAKKSDVMSNKKEINKKLSDIQRDISQIKLLLTQKDLQ
jgi:voltage-gated sodium channel